VGQQYREALLYYILDRNTLSQVEEIQRLTELDDLWDTMTTQEQDDTEKWYQGPTEAKQDLGLIDVIAPLGCHHLPRKSISIG